jgi:hypothetical protein
MEAARTSETSVDNYFTRQCIPEDNSELHTRRRENLESQNIYLILESMWFLFWPNYAAGFPRSAGSILLLSQQKPCSLRSKTRLENPETESTHSGQWTSALIPGYLTTVKNVAVQSAK